MKQWRCRSGFAAIGHETCQRCRRRHLLAGISNEKPINQLQAPSFPEVVAENWTNQHDHSCAGSIARLYADIGGAVIFAGKPTVAIYDEAVRQATEITGRDFAKGHFLAVGDGLPTDIKGAADNGFDACFITQGIHINQFGEMNSQFDVTKASAAIKSMHPHLNLVGICDTLRWN